MTDIAHLYPPAPPGVPPGLARPGFAYRWRVAAMIGGLFLFLVVYLVVIALTGLLAYWLVMLPVAGVRGGPDYPLLALKYVGAAGAGLVFVFLVKGLFKGRRVEWAALVALREADQPELFAFIRRVSEDTGAPFPAGVYASPDVNAAVFHDTSLLNLVVPPRNDLLIGLGMVNVLDLVEFKAVLAHELGHFSQHSAGLSSYLYVAHQAILEVIYRRDGFDRFVDRWGRKTWGVAFPAWGIAGVLWAVRWLLSRAYRALTPLQLSLRRQMELNADNVAVSLAGSDALIRGLARLEFANECLADAARSLDAAADHGLFTDDLFFHQSRSAGRLRQVRKDARLGLPPEVTDESAGRVTVFAPVEGGVPEKYLSHPTDHARERNAKRVYLPSPRDDRSPWLLFPDAGGLKRKVTAAFYRHALNRQERYDPRPAADVQAFIDAEHAETTYDPKYGGWYDDRFVNPGDLDLVPREPWPPEQLTSWLAGWPPADLESRHKAFRERQGEHNVLQGLRSGALQIKGETFTLRDRECTLRDVKRLLAQVEGELNAAGKAFDELDRQVFLAHWSLARHLDRDSGETRREADLLERYRFHMAIQGLLRGMLGEQDRVQSVVRFLSGNPQLDADTFGQVRDALRGVQQSLLDDLRDARRFKTPALTNVPAGSSLYDLIVDRGETSLSDLVSDNISGEWIGKLMTRLDRMLGRVKRLHFKSLGSLLAMQERLAREWAGAREPAPQASGAA